MSSVKALSHGTSFMFFIPYLDVLFITAAIITQDHCLIKCVMREEIVNRKDHDGEEKSLL